MATPTVDATSTVGVWNTGVSGATVSGSMTVGGTATLVLGFIGIGAHGTNADNLITVGNVTFDAVNETQLVGAKKHSGIDSDLWGFADIYTLASPNTGASKLISNAATISAGNLDGNLTAVTIIGSSLSVSLAGVANGENVSSLDVSTTLTADEMLLGICVNGSTIPTVTAGTSLTSNSATSFNAVGHMRVAYNTGVGTVHLTFTTDSGDYSALTVAKITSGGGGGGTFVPQTIVVAPSMAVHQSANW